MDKSTLQDILCEATRKGCTFKFGDSEYLSQHLLELVRAEQKVATCGALGSFQSGEEAMPAVGQISVALNWDGTPAVAIETTEIGITRFCDVDESFALAEGENETLAGWQKDHQEFFKRNGGFEPEMLLVCEYFKLVADFAVI